MGRGVASSKKQTYKKFARYTNSTVYAKLSKSRKTRNLEEAVTNKMSKRLHTSPKELINQLPYYKVLFEDNETAYDLKEYFKLTDDEIKLFRSRKIPASIEKKRLKELKKQQEKEEKEYEKLKKQEEKKKKTKQDEVKISQQKDEVKIIEVKENKTNQKTSKVSREKKSKSEKKSTESSEKDKKPKSRQTTLFDF